MLIREQNACLLQHRSKRTSPRCPPPNSRSRFLLNTSAPTPLRPHLGPLVEFPAWVLGLCRHGLDTFFQSLLTVSPFGACREARFGYTLGTGRGRLQYAVGVCRGSAARIH